jgi:hypothetical protein
MRKIGGGNILPPWEVSLGGWDSTSGERFRLPGMLGCDKQFCGPSGPSLQGPISAALAKALGRKGGKLPVATVAMLTCQGADRHH